MLKYNLYEAKNGRVIIVKADDLQRWGLHDTNDKPLKFTKVGSQAVAVTHSEVKIYRKPTGHQFHKEYMLHNARGLWLGLVPQFDRLARNMYEYKKTI
jgi:hypothetical protein